MTKRRHDNLTDGLHIVLPTTGQHAVVRGLAYGNTLVQICESDRQQDDDDGELTFEAGDHPYYELWVDLRLEGLDGNAFALMGEFQRAAKRCGWTDNEVKAFLKECRSSRDYDHLLTTLMGACHES